MPNVRDMANPDSPNYDKSGHRRLDRSSGVPITTPTSQGRGCWSLIFGCALVLCALAALIVGAL